MRREAEVTFRVPCPTESCDRTLTTFTYSGVASTLGYVVSEPVDATCKGCRSRWSGSAVAEIVDTDAGDLWFAPCTVTGAGWWRSGRMVGAGTSGFGGMCRTSRAPGLGRKR